MSPATVARWERAAIGVVLAAFVGVTAFAVAMRAPFEYDEAAFAVKARAWAEGAPDSGWSPHRGPGLPAVGALVVPFARGEAAYRATGVAFGALLVLATWLLGRRAYGPGPAVLAAGIVAGSSHVLRRSSQFLTDGPAAALLLLVALVVWTEMERPRPSARLLLAAPLAAGAFHLRYGSLVPVAALALAAALVWRRKVLDRTVLAAVVVLGVLLVPHLVYATREFGSPWGAVAFTSARVRLAVPEVGLGDYVRWIPSVLAGPLGGVAMIAGAVSIVPAVRRSGVRARATVFLVVAALADLLVLGATQHAEPRFAFLPVALLALAGSATLLDLFARARRRTAVRVVALAVAASFVAGSAEALVWTARMRAERGPVALAARAIGRRASGACGVLSVPVPVVTWYSGCSGRTYGFPPAAGREALLAGERFVLQTAGARGAPDGEVLRYYTGLADGPVSAFGTGGPIALVWRLRAR